MSVALALALHACKARRSESLPSGASSASPALTPSRAPRPVTTPPLPLPSSVPPDARPAPVGGNWLKCYANFQPRTRPELEVMRLGLLCGPSNGMRKVSDTETAEIPDSGAGREHRFSAQAGDCYRIFAVGAPEIEDLDIEVKTPDGARLAWDTSDDRWPIVKPDGPFCVFRDGEYRAFVHAQRGSGRYALEIWRLR